MFIPLPLTYADMVHGHEAVVHTAKAKLGPDVAHSDAWHRQVSLQAAQLWRADSGGSTQTSRGQGERQQARAPGPAQGARSAMQEREREVKACPQAQNGAECHVPGSASAVNTTQRVSLCCVHHTDPQTSGTDSRQATHPSSGHTTAGTYKVHAKHLIPMHTLPNTPAR
jgi:hypothetical protein